MKVRMLVMMSGPLETRNKGDELDLPDKEAARLLAAGYAEKIEEREAAALKSPRRRGGERAVG